MIYTCELCNYKTDRFYDLKVHNKTKKHLRAQEEIEFGKQQKIKDEEEIKQEEIKQEEIKQEEIKQEEIKQEEIKKLPKNTELNKTAIAVTTNEILLNSFGLIYLIQPAEFLNTDIYKVGMSTKMNLSRIQGQGCKSRCIFVMECVMAHKLENVIKNSFKRKFTLYKGSEYFKGSELIITDEFMSLCIEHKLKYRLDKFEITKQSNNITNEKDVYDTIEIINKTNKNSEQNDDIEKKPAKVYRCNCKKTFSCYQNLWRHRGKCDGIEKIQTVSHSLAKTQQKLDKNR
jgi:hypothetical protein